MKEYTFDKVNEKLYKEVLDNGITVYLYPFDKTKNFYATITVKYGANYTKYEKNNRVYDVIPGIAHFLEHRIMLIGEDPILSKRINDLGSLANAWTDYYATNYNIFGSENIVENIRILLDLFHNASFKDKDTEEEKGIIKEEIDMCKDSIDKYLLNKIQDNLFNNSYCNNTVIGEKEDIDKITSKSLKQIYEDFYTPNNTFIVITGNFDINEVMNAIKEYYKNKKLINHETPKRIIEKEKENVKVEYEEIKKDTLNTRVRYSMKIKRSDFHIKDEILLSNYLSIILKLLFSSTSKLFEKYKNDGLIYGMNAYPDKIDNYITINISSITDKPNEFIDNLNNDFKNLSFTKSEFENAKKRVIKKYIMAFENIEDVEYIITTGLTVDGKILFNGYELLSNMTYEESIKVLKSINNKNLSIIRTIK